MGIKWSCHTFRDARFGCSGSWGLAEAEERRSSILAPDRRCLRTLHHQGTLRESVVSTLARRMRSVSRSSLSVHVAGLGGGQFVGGEQVGVVTFGVACSRLRGETICAMPNPDPDDLAVHIPGCSGLSQPTQDALRESIGEHGRAVLEEAARIEAAHHFGNGPIQITQTHVRTASLFRIQGFLAQPQSTKSRLTQMSSYVATLGVGLTTNYITQPMGAVGFAVFSVVGYVLFARGKTN